MKNSAEIFNSVFKFAAVIFISLGTATVVRADETTSIPLKKNSLPASDLIYGPNGSTPLYPDQALQLEQKAGVDLSKLEPATTTAIYTGASTVADSAVDDGIAISAGQTVNYSGTLQVAAQGEYIMNVQVPQPDNQPPKSMSVLLSMDLHNYLARRELLRRLGYKIPGIKYLSQVKVHFPDPITKLLVLMTYIPSYTNGGDQTRWVVPDTANDILTTTLQDVFALDTSTQVTRFYNVAFGPPVIQADATGQTFLPEDRRTMRAMALIEGLLATPEDANLQDWNACRVQNNAALVGVNDVANFSCSLDDALWILNKMTSLTRADFLRIFQAAKYPEPIAEFYVEKALSRLKSLMNCFSIKYQPQPFDPKINIFYTDNTGKKAQAVKDGKVIQCTYPGIASKFCGKDQPTPIKGLGWYALSEVETNALSAAFTKLDNDIPGLTIASQSKKNGENLVQTAINNFISTGQNTTMPLAFWAAPLLNGGVNLARSIQIGNYLGTNNPVQVADSATEYLNVGVVMGVNYLPAGVGAQGLVQGTLNRTVTHVKPIVSLKAGVKEPFKHMLADLLFKSADNVFEQIQKVNSKTLSPDDISNQIAKDLEGLSDALGPGESLILTDSLGGIENFSASISALNGLAPGASLTVGGNQIVLYRLQIYRKPAPNANTIQIFRDNGELAGVNLAFEVTLGEPVQMPILSFTGKKIAGKATSKVYEINIDPNLKTNPDILNSAVIMSNVLRSRSTEYLDHHPDPRHQFPTVYSVNFHDSGDTFQFFHWMRRSIKEDGEITAQTPTDPQKHYISLLQGVQKGKSYQALASQVATYIYQRLTSDTTITIDTQANPNPGRTFLGESQTRDGSFQCEVTPTNEIVTPMVQVQYRWDGWQKSTADIVKLTDKLSKEYSFNFYPPNFLGTTQKVQLYELQLNINFYGAAIATLANMSAQAEQAMLAPYQKQYPLEVGAYDGAYRDYKKAKNANDLAKAMFNMAYNLETILPFQNLVQAVGGKQNLYMYAVLSGYRQGTEVVSNPIISDGYGTAPDKLSDGILSWLENRLDMNDGEFYIQYLRDFF